VPRWQKVGGRVVRGYRVASGEAEHSPYPRGTIEMQTPFFLERGLDLRAYHPATIGVSIYPVTFVFVSPQYTFRGVKWSPDHPAEDFSFSPCRLSFAGRCYDGWVYYPHPETKFAHPHDPSTLEVITGFVEGLHYGARVELEIDGEEIETAESRSNGLISGA
jgi:hypothetical protein